MYAREKCMFVEVDCRALARACVKLFRVLRAQLVRRKRSHSKNLRKLVPVRRWSTVLRLKLLRGRISKASSTAKLTSRVIRVTIKGYVKVLTGGCAKYTIRTKLWKFFRSMLTTGEKFSLEIFRTLLTQQINKLTCREQWKIEGQEPS